MINKLNVKNELLKLINCKGHVLSWLHFNCKSLFFFLKHLFRKKRQPIGIWILSLSFLCISDYKRRWINHWSRQWSRGGTADLQRSNLYMMLWSLDKLHDTSSVTSTTWIPNFLKTSSNSWNLLTRPPGTSPLIRRLLFTSSSRPRQPCWGLCCSRMETVWLWKR